MRPTEVPVHARVGEREAVAIADLHVARVPRPVVGRGGVYGGTLVRPGDRRAGRYSYAEDAGTEVEILDCHVRDRPCCGRDLRSRRGRRWGRAEATLQREHPQRVAAREVQLEITARGEGHVLLPVKLVSDGWGIGAGAGLELPQAVARLGIVGIEITVTFASEDQAASGRQRAADAHLIGTRLPRLAVSAHVDGRDVAPGRAARRGEEGAAQAQRARGDLIRFARPDLRLVDT